MKMAWGKTISLSILGLLLFWSAAGQAQAFKLPDTGQSSSYGTGDDGSYSINPMSFNDNGDQTITDNNTGLVWQKADSGAQMLWIDAGVYCSSLALPGSGWRLPTKKELVSIVDFKSVPSINSLYFPNTKNDLYATSTAFGPGAIWAVGFDGRAIDGVDISQPFWVRCVRGATSAYGSLSDNGDGTVIDTGINRIWQKSEGGSMSWNAALTYCDGLSLAGYSDWRLPNVKELESITTDGTPAFNRTLFPGLLTPGPYWSSTTDVINTGRAWFIQSGLGRVYAEITLEGYVGTKSNMYAARCVRGGQSSGLVKLTVSLSGSGTVTGTLGGIDCGSKCSAYFDPSAALQITLTAAPSAGFQFTSWTNCNSVNGNICSVTINGAKTATATFSPVPTYQLAVTKTGSGVVTSSPTGINCGKTCSAGFNVESQVVLTATPDTGYSFSGWEGCSSVTGNTCTVLMGGARSVKAIFVTGPAVPQLSVVKTGDGTVTSEPAGISCGATCSASYATGTPVTLTARPAAGSRLAGWSGCDSVSGDTCTVTMSASKSVSANFVWGRTLTVSRSGAGVGAVLSKPSGIRCADDCSETYPEGSTVTLIAVPDTGSSFSGWAGECSATGFMCKVNMNKDILVQATFAGEAQPKKANTMIRMVLSGHSILKMDTLLVGGRLVRLPDLGNDLANLPIKLKITAPDGGIFTLTAYTKDRGGLYIFDAFSSFSQRGTYTLQARFEGNESLKLLPSETAPQTVVVNSIPGYAVIVEGSIPGGEGLPNHNKTANRIYESLKERGFTDDNIMYFNTRPPDGIVDDTPSKQDIAEAVQTWAKSKMNATPGPFYLIMVDHGDRGVFYVGQETVSREDAASWLDTLEAGLSAEAKNDPRVVIIGSCYSGSFIPALSNDGRVIITSARSNEQSFKGPMEEDLIRSGEFFLDELFNQLKKGLTIRRAFQASAQRTMIFTRSGSGRLYDRARQHPLLDDNGDGRGSTILAGKGDGSVARDLYLGYGDTYDPSSATNPAELTAVTPTLFLDSATSSASLWAQANQNTLVSSAWAEVKSPAAAISAASDQLDQDLPRLPLTLSDPLGKWEGTYGAFTTSGTHEICYFVNDKNKSKTMSMMRSVVYKNREGNAPPSPFDLKTPEDDSFQSTVLTFDWDDSYDPDGLTYTLVLSKTEDFSTIAYLKEEIPYSSAVVGVEDNLSDVTVWYWKVYAVDSYGAKTESSQSGSFVTINNNTNGLSAIVSGYVTNGVTGSGLSPATVKASATDSGFPVLSDGFYFMKVQPGSVAMSAEAAGYGRQEIPVTPGPGEVLEVNFGLTPANPCAGTLGDDLGLHLPVVDVGGAYVWVDLTYDPSRTDAVVFELTTQYGVVTDVSTYAGCAKPTFSLVDNVWKLHIPEIVFGGTRLWADMVLDTGAVGRILFDLGDFDLIR